MTNFGLSRGFPGGARGEGRLIGDAVSDVESKSSFDFLGDRGDEEEDGTLAGARRFLAGASVGLGGPSGFCEDVVWGGFFFRCRVAAGRFSGWYLRLAYGTPDAASVFPRVLVPAAGCPASGAS